MAASVTLSNEEEIANETAKAATRDTKLVAIILAVFMALCLIYNVTLPVFEAPDEASHFRYAHYLATERRLPDLKQDLPSHEVTQPLLYYLLTAIVISPFDQSNLEDLIRLNPDWFEPALNPGYTGVRGQHLHTTAENFPYQGAVWAVRAGRLFSSVLGAVTLVLIYLIAKSVFVKTREEIGDWRLGQAQSQRNFQAANQNYKSSIFNLQSPISLLALAIVAFNPKFIHISSIVSNDIAITLAATLACWWIVRMAGANTESKPRHFFVLGAMVGIATLCKLQGLGLFVPALIAVWLIQPRRQWVQRVVALGAGFLLVAGGWFLFNTVNYGNPLAWSQIQQANASLLRIPPLDLGQIIATVPLWFTSYWGNLGIELHYDNRVNIVFFIVLVLAVIGCIIAFARQLPLVQNRAGFALLLIWETVILGMFVWWLRSYVGTENSRLIMPGVAPVAVLVAMGWVTLLPKSWLPVMALAPASMLALSIVVPFVTLQPAYFTPDTMSQAQLIQQRNLPQSESYPTFGGTVKLLHAEVGQKRVKAGEDVAVTLFWGSDQPINQSYRVVLEALDINDEVIGRRQFIPFNGRYSTQRWQPGQYFEDRYALPIDANAQRGPARIQLSLFAQYPQPGLLPIDGANTNAFLIDRIKVESAGTPPAPVGNAIASFDGMLQLNRFDVQPDRITFDWSALKQPDKDYTLFIHFLDANGNMLGQSDAQPFNGQYPTGLWDAGERVRDVREIAMPAGTARLRIGWYDAITGARLPAQSVDGSRLQDDIVLLDLSK
jgi:hypothetical protein